MSRAIAGGELGQAADRDHHVQHGHVVAKGDRLRLGRLADHAHLLGQRADEVGHDHRDQRVGHERAQFLFDLARELGGVLFAATTSSSSGVEMRPSGRTGPHRQPGLPQTNTRSRSPGPIRYDLGDRLPPRARRAQLGLPSRAGDHLADKSQGDEGGTDPFRSSCAASRASELTLHGSALLGNGAAQRPMVAQARR